jgi:anthranilate phosphoribosyltransferase
MERRDLTEDQAREAMQALISDAEPAQIAAFLVLLRAKVSWCSSRQT